MKRAIFVAALVAAAATLAPQDAQARFPRLASDGLYIGVRVIPDAALLAAWDLDVYILRNRFLSIGPALSLALLGDGQMRPGQRRQEILLAADVIRVKLQVSQPGGRWRPYVILGGGFTYYRTPEQTVTLTGEPPDGGGEPPTAPMDYSAADGFAGMLTLGAGGDVFFSRFLGVTFYGVAHFDLGDETPLPLSWMEFAVGIRFGI